MIKIRAYANCDHTYLTWLYDTAIADCLGFALIRRVDNGAETVVETFVGPEDGPDVAAGTSKPSTVWPIQKLMWADYLAPAGSLTYRVVPMCGPDFSHMKRSDAKASGWSNAVRLDAAASADIEAYFNRGVVSTQWVARQLISHKGKSLKALVAPPSGTNSVRDFLGGAAKKKLLELLETQQKAGGHVYASLFELNDPEVVPALKAFGQRAHIILANGTHASGEDENKTARAALQGAHVELHNRMVSSNHFAHHKFIVFTDIHQSTKASAVWTGSVNLTYGGICTQANNAVLIRDSAIAERFLSQWRELVKDTNDYPASLVTFNSKSLEANVGSGKVTAWFAPNPQSTGTPKPSSTGQYKDHADLRQARSILQSAKDGILFLMLNPGPTGTLLNDILALLKNKKLDEKLYIHGVANQDPTSSNGKESLIFVHRNTKEKADTTDEDIILPAAISAPKNPSAKDKAAAAALKKWVAMVDKYWKQEPSGLGVVRVHSKLIVVDPFGQRPVVITGSHNLGGKASQMNDDNMVILEGYPDIAQQYAVNVITVYNQYRWRFQQSQAAKQGQPLNAYAGLKAPWKAQAGYLEGDKRKELEFWMGQS